ncbi:MAG: aspartate--tRNA ligase [Flavobacteriales bacterium]|nr:aspartate--tRNA ligase [Flavobacteriales bacterium]
MLRSHTCGELSAEQIGQKVTLSGWVQIARDFGGMTFIDLRDRYGITQLAFNEDVSAELCAEARKLGREWVIKIEGEVTERSNKNKKIATGDIEVIVSSIEILNESKVPPFTIEDVTDGGEDIRMKYRYLDIRRNVVKNSLILRSKLGKEIRNYLDGQGFIEVETPVLIKSTPEGARDFVVPSRMNEGQFYALPQSPQTFKQLLMVGGLDKYFQIVKCFRDEDLRADRQPEFTQIDCEMSFVEREDIIEVFEGLVKHLFKYEKGIDLGDFPLMPYSEALERYGNDKPDLRFGMELHNMGEAVSGAGFKVFDDAELVVGICAPGCAGYSRKQTDQLIDWVKRPQIGATGMIYLKVNEDGTLKSSVDKFYDADALAKWVNIFDAQPGDLILVLAGKESNTRKAMSELRLEMGNKLELRPKDKFECLWVVDFPLFDYDEEEDKYHAMHHPFTAPLADDAAMLKTDPKNVRANAYDMVINGVEVGGGSIRINKRDQQELMLELLDFSPEEAKAQFGFLMDAFGFGAPPHGGIAFGFDRLCALFGGSDSIRDYIAFPKNNSGRDVMIDAPSELDEEQLKELSLSVRK